MEAALGADFSAVRVHVGPQAERIGAIAFTMGNDVYFAPGRFQPDTVQGKLLLGHELAHVVQQRQGRVRNPLGGGVAIVQDRALEAEADRIGQRAAAHRGVAQAKTASFSAPVGRTISSAVQRKTPRVARAIPSTSALIQRMNGGHGGGGNYPAFGPNPTRPALTYQPRNGYTVTHAMCVDVMDELVIRRQDNTLTTQDAKELADAWRTRHATIRDFPHAGGPDSRLHITVTVTYGPAGQRNFHVPVVFEREGQLVPDDPTGRGIT
jgi:hypothetical protein